MAFSFLKRYGENKMSPRGIRNNNPGNIDYNPVNQWKGMLPHDTTIESRFCRFESPEYGIRAIMSLLKTYQHRYGKNTVCGLITRWAPDVENDTNSYIKSVCDALCVANDEPVDTQDKNTLVELAKAIIQHENGEQPYSDETFEKAFELL